VPAIWNENDIPRMNFRQEVILTFICRVSSKKSMRLTFKIINFF